MKAAGASHTVPGMNPEEPVGDEEQFESIPWSTLTMDAGRPPWLVYVAAGAVVALVVGVLLARSFRSSAPMPIEAEAYTTVAVGPTAKLQSAEVVEEADLRAPYEPDWGGAQSAVAIAETFVQDYFTVDGAGDRGQTLAAQLGWRPPTVEGPLTYVEWARAREVAEPVDGRYLVTVSYRTISEMSGEYRRGPVRGVNVSVQVTPGGDTYVVDIPSPAALPGMPLETVGPPDLTDVPEAIEAGAQRAATEWGRSPEVLGGSEANGEWRVAVEVADESGIRWPLVVHIGTNLDAETGP